MSLLLLQPNSSASFYFLLRKGTSGDVRAAREAQSSLGLYYFPEFGIAQVDGGKGWENIYSSCSQASVLKSKSHLHLPQPSPKHAQDSPKLLRVRTECRNPSYHP